GGILRSARRRRRNGRVADRDGVGSSLRGRVTMNPADSVRHHAESRPDARVMLCDDIVQTYGDLYARSQRLANGLHALGLVAGDVVALLVGNGSSTLQRVLAGAAAGMARAPLYGHDSATRHEYLLGLTGAKALLIDEAYWHPLEPLRASCPQLEHVVIVGD